MASPWGVTGGRSFLSSSRCSVSMTLKSRKAWWSSLTFLLVFQVPTSPDSLKNDFSSCIHLGVPITIPLSNRYALKLSIGPMFHRELRPVNPDLLSSSIPVILKGSSKIHMGALSRSLHKNSRPLRVHVSSWEYTSLPVNTVVKPETWSTSKVFLQSIVWRPSGFLPCRCPTHTSSPSLTSHGILPVVPSPQAYYHFLIAVLPTSGWMLDKIGQLVTWLLHSNSQLLSSYFLLTLFVLRAHSVPSNSVSDSRE